MIVIRRTELEQLIGCEDCESEESEIANFGSLAHRCIEAYFDRAMQAGGDVPEEMQAIVDSVFTERAWGVHPDRFTDLRRLMDRFAFSHSVSMDTFASTERKLSAVIDTDVEPFMLTGTVDRTDWLEVDSWGQPTVVMITDYKTYWTATDTSFQMNVYAYLICEMHPTIQEVLLRPDFIRLRQGNEFDRSMDRTAIQAWWDETCPPSLLGRVVARYIAKREGEKMTPTGGSACQYCSKRHGKCAEVVNPSKGVPATEEEARELLGKVIRLDAAVKSHKAMLKPWVNALGKITDTVEVDGTPVTKTYGPTEPKEKVRLIDPDQAVKLGLAEWTKPRVTLRKGA